MAGRSNRQSIALRRMCGSSYRLHQLLSIYRNRHRRKLFLPIEIVHFSLFDNEITTISKLKNNDPTVAWDRLLFSAKEAVYKAISYAGNNAIPFTDIEISLLPIHKFCMKSIRSSYGTPVNDPIPSVIGEWRIIQDKKHRKQFILTTACMHNNSQTV